MEVDKARAMALYTKAADQGNALAIGKLKLAAKLAAIMSMRKITSDSCTNTESS